MEKEEVVEIIKQENNEELTKESSATMITNDLLILDGESLTIEDLQKLRSGKLKIALSEEAWARVEQSRYIFLFFYFQI